MMLFDEDDIDDDVDDDFSGALDAPDSGEVPSPRSTPYLLAHDGIEKQLLSMLKGGRFPHGLIFSGMEGIGKSVLAYRLARYLFAQDVKEPDTFGLFGDAPEPDTSLFVSPDNLVFDKIASGGHPDLRVIGRAFDEDNGRYKASVAVDDIRKIAPFMRNTASVSGGWRIVIVDDADTMTRSSQNSLLKILEEPPEKSLLILVAHRAGALLPTIYSRCVHIPFAPVPDADIEKALVGRVAPDRIPLILSMAEGSLGAAYEYAEAQHAEVIENSLSPFKSGGQLPWSAIQAFAETFGLKGNEDSQRIFKETMLWFASALVRGRLTGYDVLQSLPLSRRIKIYDDLRAHFDRCLQGNLDKRFLIMGAYTLFET